VFRPSSSQYLKTFSKNYSANDAALLWCVVDVDAQGIFIGTSPAFGRARVPAPRLLYELNGDFR
jgi:hypothetical protein